MSTLFDMPMEKVQEILLRPYQESAVSAALAGWDRGILRGLEVMPTGCGKTTVFTEICKRLGVPTLILAHRGELLEQAADRMRSQAGLTASIELGGQRSDEDSQVIVGSVQALGRKDTSRLSEFKPKLLIIDESHHAAADTYQNVMRRFGCYEGDCWTLGVTATPHRMDNKPLHGTERAIFQEILYAYTLKEAITDGWLADLRGFRVKTDVDLSKVKTTAGDYNQAELQRAVNTHARNDAGFNHWSEVASKRKTIVFCSGVDHAKDVAQLFADRGISAEAVDGSMKQDVRDGIMSRFRSGKTQVLTNVDIATEGFDIPDTGCVLLLRPTKSWALFTQMVGRGLRVLPNTVEGLPDATARREAIKSSEKSDCVVIEVVDRDKDPLIAPDGQSNIGDAPSIAGIVGLPAGLDLDGHTIGEAIDIFEELDPKRKSYISRREISFDDLTTTLTEVDILGELAVQDEVLRLSRYAWLKISSEEYILPCGRNKITGEDDRMARVRQDVLGQWHLEFSSTQMKLKHLVVGDDLQLAFKRADSMVLDQWPFIRGLINHQANWRSHPPSEGQLKYLRALGVTEDLIAMVETSGQANSLIEQRKLGRAA
jgi:ATP-dependent helicase IRC3